MTNKKSKSATKQLQKRLFILAGLISLIAILGLWVFGTNHDRYANINAITTPTAARTNATKNAKSNKLSLELYYRPDCPDCQAVDKKGLPDLIKTAQSKYNVATINTNTFKDQPTKSAKKTAMTWFTLNHVTQTPTLIVKVKGYPVYVYSGTDINVFKKLLKGINPATNKQFNTNAVPEQTTLNDGFHDKTNIVTAVNTANE